MASKKHKDPTITVTNSIDGGPLSGINVTTAGGAEIGSTNADGQIDVPTGTSVIINPNGKYFNQVYSTVGPTDPIVGDVTIPLPPKTVPIPK